MASNEQIRQRFGAIESSAGDIESDLEGLNALEDNIKCRPAFAILTDVGRLVQELQENLTLDGRKLCEVLDE